MADMEELMPTVLVVNGPNLNLLGTREPDTYGTKTLSDLQSELSELGGSLGLTLKFMQSNTEGEIVDFIQAESEKAVGLIINPATVFYHPFRSKQPWHCPEDIS